MSAAAVPAEEFCDLLAARGFTFASGVPCSSFGGPIAVLSARPGGYLAAANEGGALAAAAGAALGGARAYVMLQNSGLGNLVNPLTSLLMPYEVGVLAFVSLRGWPDPAGDEPQHAVMGATSHALVEALGVAHHTLRRGAGTAGLVRALDAAEVELGAGRPVVVFVEKGAVAPAPSHLPAGTCLSPAAAGLDPAAVLAALADVTGPAQAAVVASTGFTARDLFGLADRPGHFYMQGSMGHAAALGLGLALTRPERPVVVVEGDGAALMHLGFQSVVGCAGPRNLVHLVLDNGTHESTGGQATTSRTTSFPAVAAATGYRRVDDCRTLDAVDDALRRAVAQAADGTATGPAFVRVRTAPRTGSPPPRATSALSPPAMRDRWTRFLTAAPPIGTAAATTARQPTSTQGTSMPRLGLPDLLRSRARLRLVGAHDGLSATLVERLGFEGIWAGGLGISSSHGLPDSGVVTMTEMHAAAVQMRRASALPIVADVDSGFGDSGVVRRMVRLYEDAGIDAVCIEDKQFPKRNSFQGDNRLEAPEVAARRIEVAKAAQRGTDFLVVARHESLIAGAGMDDALRRARLYVDAGADALLIHSRVRTAHEVQEFCARLASTGIDLPVFAIPTTYHATPSEQLWSSGVTAVVYANQLVRASVTAMTALLESLARQGSTHQMESEIASLPELFDLVGMDQPVTPSDVPVRTSSRV